MDGRTRPRPGVEAQTVNIMEAALELFAAKGTGSVSISQICKAAEVSRPTFYRCFEDKPALIANIYRFAVDDSVRSLLASLADGQLNGSAARSAVDEVVDAIIDRAAYAQFVFTESVVPGSPAESIVREAYEASAQALAHEVQRATGVSPPLPLLRSTMSASQWAVQEAIRDGGTEIARNAAKLTCWQLLRMVFGHFGAKSHE